MEKKTSIIIAVVIFLIAALVAGFYELMIDKDIKENIDEKTTSIKETKNTEEKQDKKDDEMMDGVTLNYQSSIRIENGITEILKIFTHITKSIIGNRNPDIDIENYVYGLFKHMV